MSRAHVSRVLTAILLIILTSPRPSAAANEPRWIRLDSSHFSVLTDAEEKRGREVIVRFEQMRAVFAQLLYKSRVNMPEPIEIIALKSEDEYDKVAPTRQGAGLGAGFFIPGNDRYYFVLNLSQDESWRAISRNFAQVLLNYNYPPTQSWFDQGFTLYFSSLRLNDKQMQIGGDPMQGVGSAQAFVVLLDQSSWLSLPELLAKTGDSVQDGTRQPLFQAESWMVMHYLLNKEKLPAAGTYFGLVENEKLPVEEAIQKAFGMSSAQMEQAVKDYFHSLAAALQTQVTAKPSAGGFPNGVPAPATADVIGTSTHEMLEGQAQALVAEMSLRVPEHRDQARKQLASIAEQPKMDNVVTHRALAWDFMEKKDYEQAIEELGNAAAIDSKDPMTHYYVALCKFQMAQSSRSEMKGLANMMQDLHVVLDWDPEFAEAYYMLAVSQTEGGGMSAAADSIRAAIQLSPRRPEYWLELAKIYEGGKNWDAATALLERLAGNSNPEIASAATKDLHDLPYIKKYGIPPVADAVSVGTEKAPPSTGSAAAAPPLPATQQSTQKEATPNLTAQAAEEANEETLEEVPIPQIDTRPIQYLKGKLISVDCSQPPVAIVTVAAGAKTMKLRTSDYKSLMLVGVDTFSCAWANRLVSVNYKPGGKADGDLVSLEVH
jgi:tetratricopeptide (TPR) repeat protein